MATEVVSGNKPRLNICMIAERFSILGRVGDHGFLWAMAKGLAEKGHDVTVISGRGNIHKREIERNGVRILYLLEGAARGASLSELIFRKFCEFQETRKFDIVHCMDRSGYKLGRIKRKNGFAMAFDVAATQMSRLFAIQAMAQQNVSSFIYTEFSFWARYIISFFGTDRFLLKLADGVFITTPQQKLFLERFYYYPEKKTFAVPYGMELGSLVARPDLKPVLDKWNIKEEDQIILTVSDMTDETELQSLLRAFEKVAIRKSQVSLVIIGDGPHFKKVEFEMLNLALHKRVIMTGALEGEEISDFIAAAHVFVNLSARSSGFDSSMIEAMAQKKVIIGSEVSPMSQVVEDNVDGFLVRPADAESLAELLIKLISREIPVVDIGEKAHEKVMSYFDTQKMLQSLEESYFRMLK